MSLLERGLVGFAFAALVTGLYFPLVALVSSPVMAYWIVVFSWPAWALGLLAATGAGVRLRRRAPRRAWPAWTAAALNAAAIAWTWVQPFMVVS